MSLDLWLENPKCSECEHVAEHNYTYNVAQMWYEVYPDDTGMVQIEGMTGLEAQEKLLKAINEITTHPEIMKRLEPHNGWGTYEGFLEFLNKLYIASVKYSNRIWRASR